MLKRNSDNRLLKGIKSGDANALTALFNKYYQQLCRFTFIFIPDNEVVEELAANIFINFWKNRDRILIQTSLEAYLYRSAKNQALSYLRKNKPQTLPIDDGFEHSIKADQTPETIYIEHELNLEYIKVFQKLPPRAKLAFKLHRFDGLKYTEVAEIMGITVSAVEKNITVALRILHHELLKSHQSG